MLVSNAFKCVLYFLQSLFIARIIPAFFNDCRMFFLMGAVDDEPEIKYWIIISEIHIVFQIGSSFKITVPSFNKSTSLSILLVISSFVVIDTSLFILLSLLLFLVLVKDS